MAKGQQRSAKEAKKPKANKPKTSVSDYKKSVIAAAVGPGLPAPGRRTPEGQLRAAV